MDVPHPDFTYAWFAWFVAQLHHKEYEFASFDQAAQLLERRKRFVLMRHDIDMDLHKAAEFASLEAKLGVSATYFVLLRCEHYNLLSRESSDAVSKILSSGHQLGLHFDCAAYPDTEDATELAKACNQEARFLETWFGCEVTIVSFHRPGALGLSSSSDLSAPLPHTYLPQFTQDIHYCADSKGAWRFGRPTEQAAYQDGLPLQILTHPIWWNERQIEPLECLAQFVRTNQDRLHTSLESNCVVYQRETIKRRLAA